MRKIISIFICMVMVLFLSACDSSIVEHNQSESESEEYIMTYEEALKMMSVTISEHTINDERYSSYPWITDRIRLPDSDINVSIDALEIVIHVYELQKRETLGLTTQEIIDLYSTPNEENQVKFDKFIDWYQDDLGSLRESKYHGFCTACYRRYDNSSGAPLVDKKLNMYTAAEEYALVKWGLENIDSSYIDEIINNPNADYTDSMYISYLYGLGLIDGYGKPVNNN